MKRIVEFDVGERWTVPVEVEDLNLDATVVRRESVTRGAGERAPRNFQEALVRVRPLADQLIDKLRGLAAKPDEVEVQFGIKLSGEVGAVVASTSTEANFSVKLSWKSGLDESKSPDDLAGPPVR